MIFIKLFGFLKGLAQQGFFYFVLFVIFLVIVADNYSEAKKGDEISIEFKETNNDEAEVAAIPTTADSLIAFAMDLKGIPYHYAGNSLQGFDCSGFTYYVFQHFNIPLPRSSSQQYATGEPVPIATIKKGDLLFFSGTQNHSVGHVGIVIAEKGADSPFIHSSSGGGRGVTIDSLSHPHYQARFLGARRMTRN